jgi:hypothetical protein
MQETVRGWIRDARHIAVLTGAGMSAESGVPTFRDAQTGLWAHFDPQELATESAFRAHAQRVWDWYAHRREMIRAVLPNAGHTALAAFARKHPGRQMPWRCTATSPRIAGSMRPVPAAVLKPSKQGIRRAARCVATCAARRWSGSARTCPPKRSKPLNTRRATAT